MEETRRKRRMSPQDDRDIGETDRQRRRVGPGRGDARRERETRGRNLTRD